MAADNVCVSGLCMSRQKNAFCTESVLGHVLQANAPPDFHALGASNTHPILSRWVTSPGYGVGMGSDGIVLSI